jgi:hypothetical protein
MKRSFGSISHGGLHGAEMAYGCGCRGLLIGFSLSIVSWSGAAGQSTPSTENEALGEADFHVQLPSQWRVLSFVGTEQGAGYPFEEWYVAAGIGRQLKLILRPHQENIDPDNEHYLVLGAGYEYLRWTQSRNVFTENRLTFDITPSLRPASKLLLRDRNWTELRWINGNYSVTYRNMVDAESDLRARRIVFTPFGNVEFFYDSPSIPGTRSGTQGVSNFRISAFSWWRPFTGASTAPHAPLKTGTREE